MTRTPICILGTRNANRADYSRACTNSEACLWIRRPVEDGFMPSGITCIEGFERSLCIEAGTIVNNVRVA